MNEAKLKEKNAPVSNNQILESRRKAVKLSGFRGRQYCWQRQGGENGKASGAGTRIEASLTCSETRDILENKTLKG